MSHAIIIPIYCENRNTINLCNELQNFGAEHIVVVNDGLNPKSEYFNELVVSTISVRLSPKHTMFFPYSEFLTIDGDAFSAVISCGE